MAQTLSLTTVQAVIARTVSTGIHDRGRIERAATLVILGAVEQVTATTYTVRSQFKPHQTYTVTPDGCTCVDASRNPAQRCKHDIAVRILLSAERDESQAREQAFRSRVNADAVALAHAAAARRAA
ncbi:MAG: hypothetical protein AB7P40_12930 [Chloroflexota bacterium]